jgi:hypothetical protein
MKLTAKKILVMRYRFIGDTVLTVPFLRNLREAFPAARIDLMIEPFSGQVIEGCPYVDRVVPFEFKTIHTTAPPLTAANSPAISITGSLLNKEPRRASCEGSFERTVLSEPQACRAGSVLPLRGGMILTDRVPTAMISTKSKIFSTVCAQSTLLNRVQSS